MAYFDDWLNGQKKYPIYQGNPPTTEADYNTRVSFSDGVSRPSWSEVVAGVALQEVLDKRLHAYYSDDIQGLSLQLEKIYDDIDAGKFGEDAKTGQFYKFIKDIKQKYPKP
tara:strand:- start:28 stop:360 length:333 start_codon:yes stop_codon:yes gene_type:complete